MKAHTTNFKNEIKLYGKQLDSKIIYPSLSGAVELGVNELNSITPHYEGGILKSVMRGLTIDSNVEIPKGTMLNYQFGVLVNDSFEYINFGNYIVDTVEKQEDTNSYLIECCDSMLYAMKDYEAPNITYPITVRSYINAICNKIGLTFKNANDTFANYDKEIPNELYSDIGYTYRNVLDELAQVTASTICINEVDDELEIRYINDTNDTINEEYLKDVNVNFGEKYGPVNSIVLTRAGGSDSVYLQDEESIEENGLCELKIEDNQIMNLNDRADYLPDILEVLDGFEYYTNDFSSTGICYYNLCDRYNIQVGENTYSCIMFNDEVDITQGLVELIHTDMPEESETEYKYASKDDRQRNQAYIIAKKNEVEINALASKIVDVSNTISGTHTIQLENAYEGILHRLEITGNLIATFPSNDLYPDSALYPSVCGIWVFSIKDDEVDWEKSQYYVLDFYNLNYINEQVHDTYVYEDGKQWVERNVGIDEYGQKYALSETVIEQGEDIEIRVNKESLITMYPFGDYDNAKFKCTYLLENEYTSTFANQVEVTSELNLLGDTLEAKVSQVADEDGNVTSASIILAVNNDESQAVINADKINMRGKTFDLTVDEMAIESTNFSVSKEGHMRATSGEIGGFNLDNVKFYNNISGKYDYSLSDMAIIRAFILGVLGDDYAPYNIYDYSGDGTINSLDALKIGKIIQGIDENTKQIKGRVEINSKNPKNCFSVYDDNSNNIVSIGLGGVDANVVSGKNMVCGHYINDSLIGTTINGETGRIYINNPNGIVDIDPGNKFWLLNGGLNSGIQMNIPRGEISCDGDVYCNSVIQTSLKEKKKNFERLDNALDIIKNIDIYKYNMKEDKDTDKKHIGFVIGDKYNYSKEVTSNNNDGVDTYAFISVCCKAIQEQQEEINLLKQEIKLLKERIDK